MAEVVDAEARKMASLAAQKIDDHEKHCGERWGAARDEMSRVGTKIGVVHQRIDSVHRLLIAGLGSIVLTFAGGLGVIVFKLLFK